MEVSSISSLRQVVSNRINAKSQKDGASFSEFLDERQNEHKREELKQLLEKVKVKGKELVSSKNINLLVQYKTMIRNFVIEASEHAFSIGTVVTKRAKILKVVSLIDDNLLSMTDAFLKEEKDRVELLAKIGELQGLLMNLII